MKYKPEDIGDNVMVRVTRTTWGDNLEVEGLLVLQQSERYGTEYFVLTNDYEWDGEPCDDKGDYEYSWILIYKGEDYDTIRPLEPIYMKKNIKKHKMTMGDEI